MIDPVDTTLELPDGTERTYVLHKIPAVAAREIVTQYPVSGMPKIGEYETNEKMMLKLLSYVGVQPKEGPLILLASRALIDNHVPDWETLAKLEWAMMEYNCSFFRDGRVSGFLDDLLAKLPQWITSISTALSEQSSAKDTPPSKS